MTCSINGLIHKIKSTKHAMQLFKVEKYIKEKFQKENKFFYHSFKNIKYRYTKHLRDAYGYS